MYTENGWFRTLSRLAKSDASDSGFTIPFHQIYGTDVKKTTMTVQWGDLVRTIYCPRITLLVLRLRVVFTLGTLVGMMRHNGANSNVVIGQNSFPMRRDNALAVAVGPLYRDRLNNGP